MKRQTQKFLCTVMMLFSLLFLISLSYPVAATPDFEQNISLPSDGSNDSGSLYQIDRVDDSESGSLNISVWIENKTVNINMNNIENITLFFNESSIDFSQIVTAFGVNIDFDLSSDNSKINFSFVDVPQPDEVLLDGSSWDAYSWSDSYLSGTLSMSSHTVTLGYHTNMGIYLVAVALMVLVLLIFGAMFSMGTISIESVISLVLSFILIIVTLGVLTGF